MGGVPEIKLRHKDSMKNILSKMQIFGGYPLSFYWSSIQSLSQDEVNQAQNTVIPRNLSIVHCHSE